jgi:hypothetical protein
MRCVGLQVEALEPRGLLSGLTPVLTMSTFDAVVASVDRAMEILAATNNVRRVEASLANLASKIPFGRRELLPSWQGDLAVADPRVPGSALAAEQRMIGDLDADVVRGVASGELRVTGHAAAAFSRLAQLPAANVASVNIGNNTGRSITVTATLTGTVPPQMLTRTIANNGTALFDFGSNGTNYISINVRRSDGLQPPPPLTNYVLNRPISGYNGKLFTITVFANLYSVSV